MGIIGTIKDKVKNFFFDEQKPSITPIQEANYQKTVEKAPITQTAMLNNDESVDLGFYDYPQVAHELKEEGLSLFKKILEDAQVTACLHMLVFGILGQEYKIQGKDSEQGKIAKDFIDTVFEAFEGSIQNPMYELLVSGAMAGHGISEKLWKRFTSQDAPEYDGKLYISNLKNKPVGAYTLKLDRFGNTLAVENKLITLDDEKELPADKFVIFTFLKIFGNPYGQALISKLNKLVYSKNHKFNQMNIHDIKFGSPTIGVGIPKEEEDTPGIIELAQDLAESVQSGNAVSYPKNLDLDVIGEGKSSSSSDVYIPRLEYIDKQIALTILGNDLATVKTYAESGIKFKVTTIFGKYVQTQLEQLINEQIIKDMLDWNFIIPRKEYCTFSFIEDETEKKKEKRETIKTGYALLKEVKRPIDEVFIRQEFLLPEIDQSKLEAEKQTIVSENFSLDLPENVDVTLFEYD